MLIRADARQIPLRDACVQMVVTSPPYWGLRDYGTATWLGGDENCDHSPERRGGRFATPVSAKQASNVGSGTASQWDCPCGARRQDSQIGLEPTPDAYVSSLVQVFREVKRVLKADGTVWINLGDSYAANRSYQVVDNKHTFVGNDMAARVPDGLKPKDLCGIPWLVAFALRADGWYLRSDIIWAKKNCMPESVTDRPTRSHEYIFLLSKSERYYFDADAIREPHSESSGGWQARRERGEPVNKMTSSTVGNKDRNDSLRMATEAVEINPLGRNKRSVWHVATQPYDGAHFATFPETLIEPCILAGSRPGDLVFDPFIGSGTTGAVCDRLLRRWVGTDLTYQHLSKQRTAQRGLRFAEEASA